MIIIIIDLIIILLPLQHDYNCDQNDHHDNHVHNIMIIMIIIFITSWESHRWTRRRWWRRQLLWQWSQHGWWFLLWSGDAFDDDDAAAAAADYDADGNHVDNHDYHLQLDEPGSPAAPDGLGHSLDLRTPHHDPNLRVNSSVIVIVIMIMIIFFIIII